ncbi:16S rRNA (adenine(1518)-N(6)/adenine(1519)-N(6))-dimethyltransferase RsmA [Jeotgalibaca sp. MA1X17-3]|uniref:16S rRNA (adenine(1518)-N(6)/adenine(1519)-N(6))- dimethyltransferase RsmA n=1 Tax=Jeotgalibaca sp. MA1X17-3 TaxID=2908211 RepID=UPI001F3FDA72|nr:16S rRNA (adenine(1518)-N(6)/adenine(1519)-N(6))-dimethyltransferase RsmA [Jeotgalibaca sp. MA1X17-3]UJF16191.1 16S rRNA (adenine(1518)-N(6)/adenine(1519)-N(6))-dimethyltransferase RsmA [Jeotgalibaca sp. MA1X17-3]
MNDSEQKKYIATPSRTNEIIKRYKLTMKKSLGQNFIIDPNILTKMIEAGEIDKDTCVIEVGPGIGALTERLAEAAKKVVTFEVDTRLKPILKRELADHSNIEVIFQDILQANLQEIFETHFEPEDRIVVAANLPYYITTPIIMRFVEEQLPIDTFVMMMQKEVAQRMTAQPSTKAYGSLTIAIDYYTHAEIAFHVPKTVFIPQPNVDSAILKLQRRVEPKVDVVNEKFFFQLIRFSFQQRRKTLWNNLTSHFGKNEDVKEELTRGLQAAGIDPGRRAETLSIEEFATLADELTELSQRETRS